MVVLHLTAIRVLRLTDAVLIQLASGIFTLLLHVLALYQWPYELST